MAETISRKLDVGVVTRVAGPEPPRRELERFVAAMARRDRSPVDAEAGLLALRTVEAAQRSSALGRPVTLTELA